MAANRREPTQQELYEAGRMDGYGVLGELPDVADGICPACLRTDALIFKMRDTGPADEKRYALPIMSLVVNCACGFSAYDATPKGE